LCLAEAYEMDDYAFLSINIYGSFEKSVGKKGKETG
jgi:hypothetical protein